MKKTILITALLLLSNFILAQKYSTNVGQVTFEASVPLFEDVFAQDKNNVLVMNAATANLASISVVKNFKFKVKLMEEHFNENYAESAKYPKVLLKGKFLNFDKSKLTSTPQKYTFQGTLNFHGVEKPISSLASIFYKDDKIYITGNFIVKPKDFNILIPKVVSKKVAENVKVKYNYTLVKK